MGVVLEGGLLEDASANHFFMAVQLQGILVSFVSWPLTFVLNVNVISISWYFIHVNLILLRSSNKSATTCRSGQLQTWSAK